MEQQQFTDNLKKMVQAGLGAVSMGLEKAADAVSDLSEKGEPIYNQAKETVTDFAGKAWNAVSGAADKAADVISDIFHNDDEDEKSASADAVAKVISLMQQMNKQELNEVRCALEAIYPTRPEE